MAINQQRGQAIDQMAAVEAYHEKGLAIPTQGNIDDLYAEMYQYMTTKMAEAKRAKKPCLFVFGETHPTPLGKSSLIVEKIAIRIAKRLGIKNIYLENHPEALSDRRRFLAGEFEKAKIDDPKKYEFIKHKMNVINHILRDPITSTFNLIAAEPKRVTDPVARENMMIDTMSKGSGSGIFLVGLKHLKACAENSRLNKKYRVSSICTQPRDVLGRHAALDDPAYKDHFDFAANSEKVKQFSIKGKLVDTDPDLLSDMVEQSDRTFEPSEPSKSKKTTAKLKSKFKDHAPARTSVAPGMILHSEKVSSLESSHHLALPVSSPQSFSFLNLTRIDSSLVQPLIQLGLWAGSKLSLCPRPLSVDIPIISESIAAEASASRQLSTMGMTIESSLNYLFGKSFVNGDRETQVKMRKFLIEVVNGNVSKDIGEEFNAIANISNVHERVKQLTKLMESTAGERCLLRPAF